MVEPPRRLPPGPSSPSSGPPRSTPELPLLAFCSFLTTRLMDSSDADRELRCARRDAGDGRLFEEDDSWNDDGCCCCCCCCCWGWLEAAFALANRPCSVVRPLTWGRRGRIVSIPEELAIYCAFTCKFSAALRKLSSAFWDTCTSPLYMNSSRACMLSADVASSITQIWPVPTGARSNRSAKFFEHAARMTLWALKTVPVDREK